MGTAVVPLMSLTDHLTKIGGPQVEIFPPPVGRAKACLRSLARKRRSRRAAARLAAAEKESALSFSSMGDHGCIRRVATTVMPGGELQVGGSWLNGGDPRKICQHHREEPRNGLAAVAPTTSATV
jgi:hypothetical protein